MQSECIWNTRTLGSHGGWQEKWCWRRDVRNWHPCPAPLALIGLGSKRRRTLMSNSNVKFYVTTFETATFVTRLHTWTASSVALIGHYAQPHYVNLAKPAIELHYLPIDVSLRLSKLYTSRIQFPVSYLSAADYRSSIYKLIQLLQLFQLFCDNTYCLSVLH